MNSFLYNLGCFYLYTYMNIYIYIYIYAQTYIFGVWAEYPKCDEWK
jgi:hypothetical protein